MERGSTLFLRGVLILIGGAVLGICLFALPLLIRAELAGDFDYGAIFVGLYIPAIPFFFALYQAWKLLGYIDQNTAFSDLSTQALKKIKYCAITISGLFLAGLPYIFYVAERDDAPGVAAIALVIIAASFVIATFAAVLQKLLQNAFEIKSENDMTV